jgi:NADPH2:quinone reductase
MAVTTLPTPTPSPTQYLIAIHATATNFFDLLQIRGKYQHQPPLPWISGSEFAGTVLATPSATTTPPRFRVGDRVFGAAQGGYATHVCADERALRAVPAGWDFVAAAGLMVTAPTSYAALVTRAGVRAGDWVLVHAAAGGVGLAAVQIAKALGAVVVATAGAGRKRAVARAFGADHVVDYTHGKWENEVRALTPGGRGVDVVFDPVGLVDRSLRCMAWNGRIVVVGFAAGAIEKVAMNKVLLRNVSVVGLHWGLYAAHEPAVVEDVWRGLERMMADGTFRATVYTDREFVGLEAVGEALRMLGARETWGKVVVKMPQEGESRL